MSELRSRCGNTADAFGKVQYGNANRSQSVYDYQLRDLRTDGDYYDDCRFLGGNHLLDSALLGCAYDSCIQQFDKRHETALGVAFKICALLFASLIAGILMLCDNNN